MSCACLSVKCLLKMHIIIKVYIDWYSGVVDDWLMLPMFDSPKNMGFYRKYLFRNLVDYV